jgi:uncharacterized protein (DUF169 family)
MSEISHALGKTLEEIIRPATFPTAIRLAANGDRLEQKFKRPVEDFGHRITACQGLNLARTIGWTMVFGREDHACPLASVAAGHLEPDRFLTGMVADLYQDNPEVAREMEAVYPRLEIGKAKEIWISPLSRCAFEPDLAVVYGSPAQILVLIHAANYGYGPGIRSSSTGRFGCAQWIAGTEQCDECVYQIPGSGERIFAGTQDHEMSFLIPRSRFESIVQNLEIMRKKGTYRYPVPNLSVFGEPNLPEKYYELDPDKKPGTKTKY